MLIDTHAHLMFPEFDVDRKEVIERALKSGVSKIVNIGCDLKSCDGSLKMAKEYEFIYATLGMHPYEAGLVNDELVNKWENLIKENKKIVAIGECGLDYFKAKVPKDVQKNAFKLQLGLAQKLNLPVIIHNREADEDSLEILKEFKVNAVFHCYGSNLDFAQKLWAYGYMTSFTGVVTYPSARELKDVIREVPMNLFMVETDCPYLAPQMHRGHRNEPSFVTEVVREIARAKNLSYKEVERVSTENAMKFFKLTWL